MPTPWPDELPMQDGLTVLKAVAKGQLEDVLPLAANVGWVAAGYLLGLKYPFASETGFTLKAPTEAPELDVHEAIAILEETNAGEGLKALPPVVIFQVAVLLYNIAKRYHLLP